MCEQGFTAVYYIVLYCNCFSYIDDARPSAHTPLPRAVRTTTSSVAWRAGCSSVSRGTGHVMDSWTATPGATKILPLRAAPVSSMK